MSTLQQTIAQRRTADLAGLSCVTVQAGTPSLVIHTWRGGSWVFPWSHFGAAHFSGPDASPRIVLHFANHRVIIIGQHLFALLDDLAALRIGCLREVPGEYASSQEEAVAHISRIEVQLIDGLADGSLQ